MAEIAYQAAQVLTITNPAPNLDPIDVIFLDHSPGRGRIIVRVYSQAWTAWWGAMGDRNTVRTFVQASPADYVAGALLHGSGDLQRVRARKLQEVYVERIVSAIQDALRAEVVGHG